MGGRTPRRDMLERPITRSFACHPSQVSVGAVPVVDCSTIVTEKLCMLAIAWERPDRFSEDIDTRGEPDLRGDQLAIGICTLKSVDRDAGCRVGNEDGCYPILDAFFLNHGRYLARDVHEVGSAPRLYRYCLHCSRFPSLSLSSSVSLSSPPSFVPVLAVVDSAETKKKIGTKMSAIIPTWIFSSCPFMHHGSRKGNGSRCPA